MKCSGVTHQLFSQKLQSIINSVKAADVAHNRVWIVISLSCGYGSDLSSGVRTVRWSLRPRSALYPLLPLQIGWSASLQLQLFCQCFHAVQILRGSLGGLVAKLFKIHRSDECGPWEVAFWTGGYWRERNRSSPPLYGDKTQWPPIPQRTQGLDRLWFFLFFMRGSQISSKAQGSLSHILIENTK